MYIINPYGFGPPPWGTEGDTAWAGATSDNAVVPIGMGDNPASLPIAGSVSYSGGKLVLQASSPYTGNPATRRYFIAKSVAALTKPFTIELKIDTLEIGGAATGRHFYVGFCNSAGKSVGSYTTYSTANDNWGGMFGNNNGTAYASGLASPYAGPRYWRLRLNADNSTYTTFHSVDSGASWVELGSLNYTGGWIASGAIAYFFVGMKATSTYGGTATATIDYIRAI